MSFVLIQSPWPQIFSVWPEPDHNSHRTSSIIFESLSFPFRSSISSLSFTENIFLPFFFTGDTIYRFFESIVSSRIYIYIYAEEKSDRYARYGKSYSIFRLNPSFRGRACLKVNPYPATALKRIIRDKLREE